MIHKIFENYFTVFLLTQDYTPYVRFSLFLSKCPLKDEESVIEVRYTMLYIITPSLTASLESFNNPMPYPWTF